jgi:predicted RNase H-like nuclease
MSILCGIDGCKRGWIAVMLDTETAKLSATVVSTEQLSNLDFTVAAIDVPIGLTASGPRKADQLARRHLGQPRGCSVFPAPIRAALEAISWEDACNRTLAVDGTRLQLQTFGILPKIRAIDSLLRSKRGLIERLFEVHPEVSFAAWLGKPMTHGKKSAAGRTDRQNLIASAYGAEVFSSLRANLRGQNVAADDLADAFAALWTARRLHSHQAGRFPTDPVIDEYDLPMHIWY